MRERGKRGGSPRFFSLLYISRVSVKMSFLKPVLRISSNTGKHAGRTSPPLQTPQDKEAIVVTSLEILQPDEQTLEDDNAGGLGRHLGLFSTTFLIIGRIIGVGIFSTPSSITNSVGSVGAALMLWLLGLALSFAGLGVWLELGCMFPRSGGEKVYLEVSYPRPYLLSTVIFSTHAVLLGFTASGCILFAANILVAADQPVSEWAKRGIAISVLSGVTLMHVFWPHWGIRIMNVLGTIKVFVLAFVVVTGWAVLGGAVHSIPDPQASFRNAFAGSSTSSNDYATAFFKVLNSYAGYEIRLRHIRTSFLIENSWSNAAYVLNEVRRPVHTLKIAGPLGLGVCGLLYILANVSYFSVATPKEIAASGNTVAAYFFGRVFGPAAKRALRQVLTPPFLESKTSDSVLRIACLSVSRHSATSWPWPSRMHVSSKNSQKKASCLLLSSGARPGLLEPRQLGFY